MLYIPLVRIVTSRADKHGKLVKTVPPIGKAFDFTDAEVERLKGRTPPCLRRVVDESQSADPLAGI